MVRGVYFAHTWLAIQKNYDFVQALKHKDSKDISYLYNILIYNDNLALFILN